MFHGCEGLLNQARVMNPDQHRQYFADACPKDSFGRAGLSAAAY
jgi:hypothetical protein